MDFEKYERQNKFMFLDFVSMKSDGIEDAFEEIYMPLDLSRLKE